MRNKDYINIAQFAEMANVSPQSIYKRLKKKSNPLKLYFKEVEGQMCLDKSALITIYGIKDTNIECKKCTDELILDLKEQNDSTERLLYVLEQQLREKDLQLKEKDRQIKEKDELINSLLSKLR